MKKRTSVVLLVPVLVLALLATLMVGVAQAATQASASQQASAQQLVAQSPHICYRAHVQNIGWQSEVCDGRVAGTTGRSLRMEAIRIVLERRR